MKSNFLWPLVALNTLVIGMAFLNFTQKKKLRIDGAWVFVQVETIKADGTKTVVYPKEGQAIFANTFYSFCWTSHVSQSRNWALADSTKLSRFNQSIINTGSFTIKDSILTTKASFGMNPMFSNGVATFKCSFSGDTLVLRGLNVISADNIQHPVYANGAYIVSKLLKVKGK